MVKCVFCGAEAEYVFLGLSLCAEHHRQIRAMQVVEVLPNETVEKEPLKPDAATIKNLHQRYPLHTEEQIAKMLADEVAKGGGFVGSGLAAEIVESNLKKLYEVKKPVEPKASAPPIRAPTGVEAPTDLISEIKTELDQEGFDVSRLIFTETEKTVMVKPRAFLANDWGLPNTILKGFKAQWIREGKDSRWEVRK